MGTARLHNPVKHFLPTVARKQEEWPLLISTVSCLNPSFYMSFFDDNTWPHTDNHPWLTRLQIHVLHPNITLCDGVHMWGNRSQTATSSLFLGHHLPQVFQAFSHWPWESLVSSPLGSTNPCLPSTGMCAPVPSFYVGFWVSTANALQAPHTPSYIRALHLVSLQSLLPTWKTSCIPKGHFKTFTACWNVRKVLFVSCGIPGLKRALHIVR